MSADNVLGIYKINNRKFVAHNCFSECEQACSKCENPIIFTATSIKDAVLKAEKEMGNLDTMYEYNYRFHNLS